MWYLWCQLLISNFASTPNRFIWRLIPSKHVCFSHIIHLKLSCLQQLIFRNISSYLIAQLDVGLKKTSEINKMPDLRVHLALSEHNPLFILLYLFKVKNTNTNNTIKEISDINSLHTICIFKICWSCWIYTNRTFLKWILQENNISKISFLQFSKKMLRTTTEFLDATLQGRILSEDNNRQKCMTKQPAGTYDWGAKSS